MTTISIIQTTNDPRGDMLLKGVYGVAGQQAEEGATRSFAIAPEFSRLSALFSNLNSLPVPIGQSAMIDLDVSDALAPDVKNQLMLALASRWNNLYNQVAPTSPVLQAMLRAESAMVSNGIKAHFSEQGVSIWAVPVTAMLSTAAYGYEFNTTEDVLNALDPKTVRNVQIADNLPIKQVDEVPGAAEDRTIPGDVIAEAGVNPQWYEFDGVQAEVGGVFNIVARDADHARQVVTALAAEQGLVQGMAESNVLFIQVKQVIAVRELFSQNQHDVVDAGSTEPSPSDVAALPAPSVGASDVVDDDDTDDDDFTPRVDFRF